MAVMSWRARVPYNPFLPASPAGMSLGEGLDY
jgi:hypothetical protein